MFSDEFLAKILLNIEMQSMPAKYSSCAIKAFTEVLEDVKGERPNVSVSELFDE